MSAQTYINYILIFNNKKQQQKNMIKYFTNSEFREAYKFLNSYNFIEPTFKFNIIGFQKIRHVLNGLLNHKNLNFFIECFKILEENKNKPN